MVYFIENNNLIMENEKCFNLALSVDCGQSFRWTENGDGSFHGIVANRSIDIFQNETKTIFYNTAKEEFESIWVDYFNLKKDYESICKSFDEENLKKAVSEFYGIRILKQDPWEAICSFIISQNNNIPRIKGIIARLCENFGEKINENDYGFPSYDVISKLSETDLAPIRAGFRSKYIIDAARKLASGEISIENINEMPIEEARKELMKIKGVGPKVAECALLYGFGRTEAFPIDVWVKKILAKLYPDGLPECIRGVEGIAQQYLFHWRRNSKLTKFEDA